MATEKEQQELIETLKFTPRNYTITLWGYGGEVAVAKINKEQFDYWKPKIDENGDSDLVEHCVDWDNEIEVPKEARICENGAWYEVEGQIITVVVLSSVILIISKLMMRMARQCLMKDFHMN